jgi:hypothetical protein
VDLAASVTAMFEREGALGWSPDPDAWKEAPEKGAFRA